MRRIAGIDGCRAGWLRVERAVAGGSVTARIFGTALELFADAADFEVMAIDVPIGLPESGPRQCDLDARALIQPRGSSVFPAPLRCTLDAPDYPDACARSRAASGKALSKQAFAILPRIHEVDAALRADPSLRSRVREVHPEVCFRVWQGAPLSQPKKTGMGFAMRLVLVDQVFPGAFVAVRKSMSRRDAADDDLLDAFAALWTADRDARGLAYTVPAHPPVDEAGLRMEMLV